MDKYSKLFIKTSIIYLALGVFFGLHMSFADHGVDEIRFIHIHVMLLGFMAMIIYGVAYHILPRFNAKPIPYPGWIPVQYWMANIGLWGMSALYAMGGFWETGPLRMAFGFFGLIEGIAIVLFVINIYIILKDEPEEDEEIVPAPSKAESAPSQQAPEVKLSPSMKISEILEKWPHLQETMIEEGFADVANPAAVNTIGKMITLDMAANKAGKNTFEVMASLEGKKLLTSEDAESGNVDKAQSSLPPGAETITHGQMASFKTLIGPLLETYPETTSIFETHYGAACFTCPGHKTETVEQTAAMHGMPPQKILDEINAVIETSLKK